MCEFTLYITVLSSVDRKCEQINVDLDTVQMGKCMKFEM